MGKLRGRNEGQGETSSIERAVIDATQGRLALLVRAGELFHSSLDLAETLSNVARMAVESFSNLCLFDLLEHSTNRLYVSVGAHSDPEIEPLLKELVTPILQSESRGVHPARYVAQSGRSFFVPVFDEATLLEHASSDEHEALMRRMDYRSKIVVPVVAHEAIFGALTFVRVGDAEPFDRADVQVAQELGRRAGLAVANAAQFSREQATQRRLALLVRAGELFHRSLDLEETLSNVARTAIESFSDLCLFDLLDEATHKLYVSVGAHRDPEIEPLLKALVTPILQSETRGMHPARHVAQSGESFFVPVFNEQMLLAHASSDEHEAFMRRMNYRSKIVVPVVAHEAVFGALTFVRVGDGEPFDSADMRAAQELGRRAGLAVANAKQYSREQHVADTLQRAFLSDEMPRTERLRFSATYAAARKESALGGDWYDAFRTPAGIVLTIGDVTGKGVDAARLMVRLRQWARMAAIVTQEPGEMLNLLNRALVAEGRDELATALIGLLDPNGRIVRYASAGHPAPAAKPLHGEPFFLPLEPGPPLGANVDESYATHTADLDGIALMVFYTDGLTEMERDPIAGEIALKELLAGDEVLYAGDASRFVMRLAANKEALDDMAVMAVQIGDTSGRWTFNVSDPGAAYAIKRDYVAALEQYGTANVAACEVIFGELIGNVLRYAPGPLGLALSRDAEGVWLHVMDEGPGFEAIPDLPEDMWAESGRGLFLVHALARRVVIRRLYRNGSYVKVLLPVDVPAGRPRPKPSSGPRSRATT